LREIFRENANSGSDRRRTRKDSSFSEEKEAKRLLFPPQLGGVPDLSGVHGRWWGERRNFT
jgi:hypothetical protein